MMLGKLGGLGRVLAGGITAVVLEIGFCFGISRMAADRLNPVLSDTLSRLIHDRVGKMGHWIHPPQMNLPRTGTMDSILFANLVPIRLTADYGPASASLNLHLGLLLFLLVPLIALSVGGYISTKLVGVPTASSLVRSSLGIGLMHGVFLTVVSQHGGFASTIHLPLFMGSVAVRSSFAVVPALVQGFMVGVVFSLTGGLLNKGMVDRFKRVHHGAGAVFLLAGTASLVGMGLFVVLFLPVLFARGGVESGVLTLAAPQAAWYLWNLAHFGSWTVSLTEYDLRLSWLGGVEGFHGATSLINVLLRLLPLAAVGVLLWAGRRLYRMGKGDLRSLVLFSGSYGFIMASLCKLTVLSIQAGGKLFALESRSMPLVSSNVRPPATFFTSFILSFCILYLARFLPRKNGNTL